jgi:hypothetical protein
MEGGGGGMPTGGGAAIIELLGPALELKISCNVGGGAAACIVDNMLEVARKSWEEDE